MTGHTVVQAFGSKDFTAWQREKPMHPIIFSFGPYIFYTHGVFAVLGIVLATVTIYFLARKRLDCTRLFDNIVYAVVFGIIGARLTYYILYYDRFENIKQLFFLWQGGLVSYGGFIIGTLALIWLLKKQKQPVWPWLELVAVAFPLGLAIGRLGEYISGENFGAPIRLSAGQVSYVPINLYESLWCLAVFLFLLVVYNKWQNKLLHGVLFLTSLILYAGGRLVIDQWRAGEKLIGIFSLSQIASLIILIISLVVLTSLIIGKKGRRWPYQKSF